MADVYFAHAYNGACRRGSFKMAGRRHTGEYTYAELYRWDNLNERWENHFRENALVEVVLSGGRPQLLCETPNALQSV